jgi:hypothetical protein
VNIFELVGKTISHAEYMAMDTANNTNGNNETIILTFTDGTTLKVWSHGYSLDTSITHSRYA